ncbi:hypothetical protein ABZ442_27440 [Streptomyces triculaminicus]|uniref:hypothetical protein n=1 Tax=Streptomyces triculaminicus TaxID=2816232 RepID=UPI0033D308F9
MSGSVTRRPGAGPRRRDVTVLGAEALVPHDKEGEQCRVVTGSGLYVSSVDRASVGRLPHDNG